MLFVLQIIVYVFKFKKLYIDTGARSMENHKLDKLVTSGELFFLWAIRQGEIVFHPFKSLHFCGFSLVIQTSPFQPLESDCSVEAAASLSDSP